MLWVQDTYTNLPVGRYCAGQTLDVTDPHPHPGTGSCNSSRQPSPCMGHSRSGIPGTNREQETRQTDHYSWQCHSCWISEQSEDWQEKNCSDSLGWGYDLVFAWNPAEEWCRMMMVSWKSPPGYRMDGTTVYTEPSQVAKRSRSSNARWITEQEDLKLMERDTRERYWLRLIAHDECNKFINFLSTLISGMIHIYISVVRVSLQFLHCLHRHSETVI